MITYLATITGYDLVLNSAFSLYFSSGQGYTDPATHQYYEPRLEQPGIVSAEMFSDGQIGGQTLRSFGEIVLVNSDLVLDYLANTTRYAFDGRSVSVKCISPVSGSVLPAYKAVIHQVTFELDTVSIRLRDYGQKDLESPIRKATYLGNNTPPNGLEGSINLKGAPKPRIYGYVYNMTPVLVNSSRLIYQVHDGAIYDVGAVYDKGAALTKGADYTSQTDMETTAPAAGIYRIWPAGGYFRLGSSPSGLITCDAKSDDMTGTQSTEFICNKLAIDANWISIDLFQMVLLNSVTGIFPHEQMTFSEALVQILSSNMAFLSLTLDGGLIAKSLLDAWGNQFNEVETATLVVSDTEIIRLQKQSNTVNGVPAPPNTIALNYGINYTVQDSSTLAGSVSLDRREWLEKASRQTSVTDSVISAKRLLSNKITYETLIQDESVALDEANRRLAMFNNYQSIINITIPIDDYLFYISSVPFTGFPIYGYPFERTYIGKGITISSTRFNISGEYKVVAVQYDFAAGQIDLTLWGAG